MELFLKKLAIITAILGLVTAIIGLSTAVLKYYLERPKPPVPQPVPDNLLLKEDFEDGKADDFRFTGEDWQVIKDGTGNKVLQVDSRSSEPTGAEFGPTKLGDYSIQYRVKLVEYNASQATEYSGLTMLVFRQSTQGTYVFSFSPYAHEIAVSYSSPPKHFWESLEGQNGTSRYDFQKDVWYSVSLEIYGTHIKAYLDGKLLFSVDDTKLKEGQLAFNVGTNTIAQFDDVQVTR